MRTPDFLFLVTSAIHTRHGVFDTAMRLEQTLGTLKSIRTQAPGARIVVLEMGAKLLHASEQEALLAHADAIQSHAHWPVVQALSQLENHDIVKNLTEITVFGAYLSQLAQTPESCPQERVFKLSGRYVLTSEFDLTAYAQEKRCVFTQARASQFHASVTGGVPAQLMSRLWSFHRDRLPEIAHIFSAMPAAFRRQLSLGGYIDIEHLLWKMIPAAQRVEWPRVGVAGQIGPTGHAVSE